MVEKIQLMGIVNLTGDSFFPDSRMLTPEGADEEWRRLSPALKALREAFPSARISVDTYWAPVVERVFDAIGPFLVNDISSGSMDLRMLGTVGRLGLPYVAMHMRGTPENMQSLTDYDDVVGAVQDFFRDFALRAADAGITDWILDPGFGFAKTLEQNWELLEELDRLQALQRPILVGVSRKSMIYKRFGITPEESLPATQVAHYIALEHGATWLRVHDIAEARRTVSIFSGVRRL